MPSLVYKMVLHLVERLGQIGRAHALVEPLISGVVPKVRRFLLKGLSHKQWPYGECNHEKMGAGRKCITDEPRGETVCKAWLGQQERISRVDQEGEQRRPQHTRDQKPPEKHLLHTIAVQLRPAPQNFMVGKQSMIRQVPNDGWPVHQPLRKGK